MKAIRVLPRAIIITKTGRKGYFYEGGEVRDEG
jgi:hypothetical protein